MLLDFDRDDALKNADSIFEVIITAAKRARNIKEEGKLMDEYKGTKDVSMAIEELIAGKIKATHKE